MESIEKLREELSTNFLNNKINIELEGDITYKLKIENAQILLNKVYLIMSDDNENQINICLDEVKDIEVKERYVEMFFTYEQKIKIFR